MDDLFIAVLLTGQHPLLLNMTNYVLSAGHLLLFQRYKIRAHKFLPWFVYLHTMCLTLPRELLVVCEPSKPFP